MKQHVVQELASLYEKREKLVEVIDAAVVKALGDRLTAVDGEILARGGEL